MMMSSACCLVAFLLGVVGLSVLLVMNFNGDSAKANKTNGGSSMLDLAPPAFRAPPEAWLEVPTSLLHPLFPPLPTNTGWLGVALAQAPTRTSAVAVAGLVRVPREQASQVGRLELEVESRSTGERTKITPTFIELPAVALGAPELKVNLERASRDDRLSGVTVGFFVPSEKLASLPPAEYRVTAQVDFAFSNELKLQK